MIGLLVVMAWFLVVAVSLVQQWWRGELAQSELAQARTGVDAPAPASPARPLSGQPVPSFASRSSAFSGGYFATRAAAR